MTEQRASPDDQEASEHQLDSFVAKFAPEIAERVRACRAALRKRLPTANELVYDNYNALAIGYAPGEKTMEGIVSLAVYPPRSVVLYFLQGASLPDPDGVLTGNGTRGRFIRLPSGETLREPQVEAMLRTALAHAARPLPETGSGRTIIKSISAKQRPRRPEGKAAA